MEMILCVLADSELHAPDEVKPTLGGERTEWSRLLDLAFRLYERGFREELEAGEDATA